MVMVGTEVQMQTAVYGKCVLADSDQRGPGGGTTHTTLLLTLYYRDQTATKGASMVKQTKQMKRRFWVFSVSCGWYPGLILGGNFQGGRSLL